MLTDIKKMLIEKPEAIVSLLEEYDFCHIHPKSNEIRFARNESGGQNISIRLENNDGLYVKDFVKDTHSDIIGYIMEERGVKFYEVLVSIKKILGLREDWRPKECRSIFGGFYDTIGVDYVNECKEYPEMVMDKYDHVGNKRWMKDGISLETQKKYGVGYDTLNDLIVFPWRSATSGNIIAVKARINYQREDGGLKYYYVENGQVSQSLFGYSENYDALFRCKHLFVFESEKSVMLLDTWGMRNGVAIGSHSLSDVQAKLIMALDPEEVWFMMDKDLDLKETKKNIEILKSYSVMKSCRIKFWDWEKNKTVCEKGAPVDMGRAIFEDICKNEMREQE